MEEALTSASKCFARKPVPKSWKRWGLYLIESMVLIGLLFLMSRLVPVMPSFVIALLWAVLTFVMTIGHVYRVVVKKTYRQVRYREGGMHARFNNGRILSIIIGFVFSAVCSAGLILSTPRWGTLEWILTVISIPLYIVVFLVADKLSRREYTENYRLSGCLFWSYIVVGVLLVVLYTVATLVRPMTTYDSAVDAFLAAKNPLEGASSTLVSESGILMSFVDGMKLYGISTASHVSAAISFAIVIILSVSTFFGIAGLLRVASIDIGEMKRVFSPLPAEGQKIADLHVKKAYIVVAAAMPAVLIASFVGADSWMATVATTQGYTMAERFVRDQMDLAIYVLDGKYYDQRAVEMVREETERKVAKLGEKNSEVLTNLINESFDKRLENVDDYLDWYYSLPADYERLASMITGSAEEFVTDQFTAHIENGIDDSAIDEQLERYAAQIDQYRTDVEEELAAYEMDDVPEWLIVEKEELDDDFFSDSFEPAQRLLDANDRVVISSTIGLAAGVLMKAASKQFFKKFVSQIGSKLGASAIGSAIGGTAGTVAGPLGTVAGLAAGAAVGVGVDALMLNIDEWQNRDEYKAEIVEAIEEQRSEVLGALG